LALIDATARGWTSAWHRAGMGPAVQAIARTESSCWVLTLTMEQTDAWGNNTEPWEKWEKWKFDLPGPILQRQITVPDVMDTHNGLRMRRTVNEEGFCAEILLKSLILREDQETMSFDMYIDGWGATRLHLRHGTPDALRALRFLGNFCAALIRNPEDVGPVVLLVNRKAPLLRHSITLEGHSSPTIRLSQDHLIVADNHGRVLALDLRTGQLVRDLRLNV
jgi:hypothetical protein